MLCYSCYTSQNNFVLLQIVSQTFVFKKLCKRKPKPLLDLYADERKKCPSYVKTPMSRIVLSTLKLCGRVKLYIGL